MIYQYSKCTIQTFSYTFFMEKETKYEIESKCKAEANGLTKILKKKKIPFPTQIQGHHISFSSVSSLCPIQSPPSFVGSFLLAQMNSNK